MKKASIIFLIFCYVKGFSQKDTLPYNRKQEIVYDGKRYRKWNNYLTFGGGKAYSDIRRLEQSVINVDFQYHLTKQYFQTGFYMSGDDFLRNTNIQGHFCYGYRIEKELFNLAAFIGPSYSYFVVGKRDTAGVLKVTSHDAIGGYIAIQGVYKVKYDVGIGLELFADVSALQKMVGARIICYFSGAYRGMRKGYRPKSK